MNTTSFFFFFAMKSIHITIREPTELCIWTNFIFSFVYSVFIFMLRSPAHMSEFILPVPICTKQTGLSQHYQGYLPASWRELLSLKGLNLRAPSPIPMPEHSQPASSIAKGISALHSAFFWPKNTAEIDEVFDRDWSLLQVFTCETEH